METVSDRLTQSKFMGQVGENTCKTMKFKWFHKSKSLWIAMFANQIAQIQVFNGRTIEVYT